MNLSGIHHVTVETADIERCHDFYHGILGMMLVKKPINFNNTTSHRLSFGDAKGSPGTLLNFISAEEQDYREGTNGIYAYSLRVPTDRSLYYFKLRFDEHSIKYDGVIQLNGRHALPFYDMDDRLVYLVSDENNIGIPYGTPHIDSPVDSIHQIVGLGPVLLRVEHTLPTASVLKQLLGMDRTTEYKHQSSAQLVQVFSMAEGGNGGEVHILQSSGLTGQSGVHHAAFRAADEDTLKQVLTVLESANVPNSGIVDDNYFKSLYFNDLSGILFGIATDSPGIDGHAESL
ncbi:VOC family protein [Macrococcus equipercicus]|uniref:VOC family protein n=1 Tax=Macrococcus equipercicus TaxID=69967 RepID=A0A9Q9BRY9_9STAP|nr:VOC family protein [Macrococcus equipercicus]UTH12816.1 VOC family protein [Macrococcus equipercicus]